MFLSQGEMDQNNKYWEDEKDKAPGDQNDGVEDSDGGKKESGGAEETFKL
jgi:hypothetical protein